MKTFWGQSFHQRQERVWAMGVIWSSALFWEHWATNNSTWQLHWVWPYGDIQISERSLWRRGGKGWGRILTWLLPITTHPLRMAEKIFCSLNCPSPKKKILWIEGVWSSHSLGSLCRAVRLVRVMVSYRRQQLIKAWCVEQTQIRDGCSQALTLPTISTSKNPVLSLDKW